MDDHINCPSCFTRLRLPEGETRAEVRCPKCQTTFSPRESATPYYVQPEPDRPRRDEPADRPRRDFRRYDDDDEDDHPRRGRLPRELPGKGATTAAVALLVVHLLSDAGVIVCELAGAKFAPPTLPGEPPPGPNDLINPLGCVQLLVLIPTIVLFCVWMYRSYANLQMLGVRGLGHSPGWAVGYFFIPILNLFRPCQVAQEMWRASDPDVDIDSREWQSNSLSGVIAFWWLFWILDNIAGQIAFRMAITGNAPPGAEDTISIVASALSIAAGLFAILMMLQLRRRQEEKFATLFDKGYDR